MAGPPWKHFCHHPFSMGGFSPRLGMILSPWNTPGQSNQPTKITRANTHHGLLCMYFLCLSHYISRSFLHWIQLALCLLPVSPQNKPGEMERAPPWEWEGLDEHRAKPRLWVLCLLGVSFILFVNQRACVGSMSIVVCYKDHTHSNPLGGCDTSSLLF